MHYNVYGGRNYPLTLLNMIDDGSLNTARNMHQSYHHQRDYYSVLQGDEASGITSLFHLRPPTANTRSHKTAVCILITVPGLPRLPIQTRPSVKGERLGKGGMHPRLPAEGNYLGKH